MDKAAGTLPTFNLRIFYAARRSRLASLPPEKHVQKGLPFTRLFPDRVSCIGGQDRPFPTSKGSPTSQAASQR